MICQDMKGLAAWRVAVCEFSEHDSLKERGSAREKGMGDYVLGCGVSILIALLIKSR